MENTSFVNISIGLFSFLVLLGMAVLLNFLGRKVVDHFFKKKDLNENKLMRDFRGRQLYVHQSHILMAGYGCATECINCGGNSLSTEALEKLLVNCSMELSVYNGNNKFKTNTGETHV